MGTEIFDVVYLVLSGTTTAARCPELLRGLVGLGFSTVIAVPTPNALRVIAPRDLADVEGVQVIESYFDLPRCCGITRSRSAWIPGPFWGAAGGGAGADRDAPSRFSPRRGWIGGDGAIGFAAGSVLRNGLRVSLEASRPGEDAGLRRDRAGADLEAAGRGQVQMAGDQRRGDAAVRGAAGRVIRRAGLAAGVRTQDQAAATGRLTAGVGTCVMLTHLQVEGSRGAGEVR